MPVISRVSLALDGAAIPSATPALIGSASATLTPGAPYLVFARGNARNLGGGIAATLELRIGGTVWSRMSSEPPFAGPAYGPLGSPQLASIALVTAGASDEMEWYASDDGNDGVADSLRAHALDLTDIADNNQRWHQQSANDDTIVSTPTSGYTTLGTAFTVTPPRSGDWMLLVSAEVVAAGGAASTDGVRMRVTQDAVYVPGSRCFHLLGFSGVRRLTAKGYTFAARRSLVGSQSYTFAVQADGTAANGNVGFRRIRYHLIECAAIEDADVLVGTDVGETVNAGEEGGSAHDVSGIGVTMAPPAARDYLVLATLQGQFSAWPRASLRAASTNYPTPGFVDAAVGTGTGEGDDMTLSFGCDVIPAVTGSVGLGLRLEAAAGGSVNLWGSDCTRTDDGTGGGTPEGDLSQIFAIRLASASSDETGSGTSSSTETDRAAGRVTARGSATSTASTTDRAAAVATATGSAQSLGVTTDRAAGIVSARGAAFSLATAPSRVRAVVPDSGDLDDGTTVWGDEPAEALMSTWPTDLWPVRPW